MKKVEAIGSGQVHIHKVDYSDPKYARDLLSLLDHYASDVCKAFGYLFHSKNGSRTGSEVLDNDAVTKPRERSASANKKRRTPVLQDQFFTILKYYSKAK